MGVYWDLTVELLSDVDIRFLDVCWNMLFIQHTERCMEIRE